MLELYNKCCSELPDFEIWEGYYKIRYEEFKKFSCLFPEKKFSETLEIGCGIGFQSAFLSCLSDKVTASDVDYGGMIQHSRGLELTHKFIESTGIGNIDVINANAENLPFADEQFDFIYCSYSFQYVLNKNGALREIKRVLKKDGHFFCILPTSVYRIKAAFKYYPTVSGKILRVIGGIFAKKNVSTVRDQTDAPVIKKHTRLLPPPDDDNNSFLSELYLYSTRRWKKLFSNNAFEITNIKYTSFKNHTGSRSYLNHLKDRMVSDGIIILAKK